MLLESSDTGPSRETDVSSGSGAGSGSSSASSRECLAGKGKAVPRTEINCCCRRYHTVMLEIAFDRYLELGTGVAVVHHKRDQSRTDPSLPGFYLVRGPTRFAST